MIYCRMQIRNPSRPKTTRSCPHELNLIHHHHHNNQPHNHSHHCLKRMSASSIIIIPCLFFMIPIFVSSSPIVMTPDVKPENRVGSIVAMDSVNLFVNTNNSSELRPSSSFSFPQSSGPSPSPSPQNPTSPYDKRYNSYSSQLHRAAERIVSPTAPSFQSRWKFPGSQSVSKIDHPHSRDVVVFPTDNPYGTVRASRFKTPDPFFTNTDSDDVNRSFDRPVDESEHKSRDFYTTTNDPFNHNTRDDYPSWNRSLPHHDPEDHRNPNREISEREKYRNKILVPDLDPLTGKPRCLSDPSDTYCETVSEYPKNVAKTEISMSTNEFREIFGADTIEGRKSYADDSDASDEERVCKRIPKIIYPQMGRNQQNQWVYIVNDVEYTQAVISEVCEKEGKSCLYLDHNLPAGVYSRCRQKFSYKRLLAIHPTEKKTYTDTFQFPSCCACYVKGPLRL